MKILADVFVSIIQTILIYYLYNAFLTRRPLSNKLFYTVLCCNGLFCFFYSSYAQEPLQRTIGTIIFIIIPLFLYHGKLSFKAALGIIFYATMGLVELLTKALLLGVSGDLNQFFMNYEFHYLLGVLFSKTGTIILVYIYTRIPKLREQKISLHLCAILIFIPLLSILIFYALQQIVYTVNTQEIYVYYSIITFTLLIFNLLLFYLFFKASESSWLRARLEYEEKTTHEQLNYYKNLSNYHHQVRQLHHDTKNHLLVLYALLTENNSDNAKKYIESELQILNTNKTLYSSYLLLDTLFSYKKQLAGQQKTNYVIYSELEPNLTLSEDFLYDLSIVISSCLDNALEATAKIKNESQRKINVFIYNDATYVYFRIKNSIATEINLEKNTLPKTTKRDTLFHGLGLRNVKRIIRKNDGELSLDCSNEVFTVFAMLKYASDQF